VWVIPEATFSLILACCQGEICRDGAELRYNWPMALLYLTSRLHTHRPYIVRLPVPRARRSLAIAFLRSQGFPRILFILLFSPSPPPSPHLSPMPQSPTCSGIKIRSVHDAQVVLYACHIGRLEMIKMRLDSADRHALASGNVYAWEERSPRSDPMGSGIERFTEGKRWTASRLRDVRRHPPTSDPISTLIVSSAPS
jgi:hypothetical protein